MSTAQLSRQLLTRGRASQLSARKVAAAPRAGNAGCQPASSHSSSAALSARSPAFSVRQLQAGATPWHLGIQSGPQLLVQRAAGPKGLLWPASTGRVELAKRGSSAGRFSFIGTVAATDMSRATDSREAGRVGVFGSALSYGGSYGRVTNEAIGRDVNPLGRGDGNAYLGGSLNFGGIYPVLPKPGSAAVSAGCRQCQSATSEEAVMNGTAVRGNSVNNGFEAHFWRCPPNCDFVYRDGLFVICYCHQGIPQPKPPISGGGGGGGGQPPGGGPWPRPYPGPGAPPDGPSPCEKCMIEYLASDRSYEDYMTMIRCMAECLEEEISESSGNK